jgi:hypothetical protein
MATAMAAAIMAERRKDYAAANEWQEIVERIRRKMERNER